MAQPGASILTWDTWLRPAGGNVTMQWTLELRASHDHPRRPGSTLDAAGLPPIQMKSLEHWEPSGV